MGLWAGRRNLRRLPALWHVAVFVVFYTAYEAQDVVAKDVAFVRLLCFGSKPVRRVARVTTRCREPRTLQPGPLGSLQRVVTRATRLTYVSSYVEHYGMAYVIYHGDGSGGAHLYTKYHGHTTLSTSYCNG